MNHNALLRAATFLFVIGLIAVLAWLTLSEPEDPCAAPGTDVSAAILADQDADQDALANRAIIIKGKCAPPAKDK